MKRNNVLLNICSNMFLQFVTVVSAFVIPRIILSFFGSEVNGLIGSLTQFLSYINLAEGGIGGIITSSLYKPLVEKNTARISSIIFTAKRFYRNLGLVLVGYSILLAIIYPILSNSSFSFTYISTMTLIISFQLLLQYAFAVPYQQLLKSDKKVYVVSFIQSIIIIINTVAFILVAKIFPNIHVVKAVVGLAYIVQPFLLNRYVKKHYALSENTKEDVNLLKAKWDGFAINIAYFVHTSTDISILTFFSNLSMVSIYTVHAVVTNGARRIAQAISLAVSPSIGHIYAKGNKEALREKFSTTESLYLAITSSLLTVIGLLIIPFVRVYTGNITDVNYYQPLFAILLVVAEYIYCIREPYFNLAQAAGKFKDMKKHAWIEASLNLMLSIILVRTIGLAGVAAGTLAGNLYRTVYHVFYLKTHILFRSPKVFIKKISLFGIASVLSITTCLLFFPMQSGMSCFVINAIIYTIITGFYYLVILLLFFRKDIRKVSEIRR